MKWFWQVSGPQATESHESELNSVEEVDVFTLRLMFFTLILFTFGTGANAGSDGDELQRQKHRLEKAIQIPTITGDGSAMKTFQSFLHSNYPHVFAHLKEVEIENSMLLEWTGRSKGLKPFLFLGHLDVVPIGAPAQWKHPPFSGAEADGFIWGRGTLDMKSSVIATFEALEKLTSDGFEPERSLFFAFGTDEETGGNSGAAKLAAYLEVKLLLFETTFDEGLTLLKDGVPGLQKKTALIGIAQKGFLTLHLKIKSVGGHSSMPDRHTAIGVMAEAIRRLEDSPFAKDLPDPVRLMLETLAPYESALYRFLFSNLWLTKPLLLFQFAKNPQTAAMIRTTTAFTMIHGGLRDNVLPQEVDATVNFRLLPGDSSLKIRNLVKEKLNDLPVEITEDENSKTEASRISTTDSQGYRALATAIASQFPDAIIAPSLMIGSADCRHYANLTQNTYRFLPLDLSKEELSEIHGDNEKISIDNYRKVILYYYTLVQKSAALP